MSYWRNRSGPKLFPILQPATVVKALEAMAAKKSPANMLFYGSPGLGKTSAARVLLSALGDNWFEINGSLSTGIDIVRDIEIAANSGGLGQGPRVCFIDEAEFLTPNAQAGLRGIIERVHLHCRFLLTANDIRKFQPALKSRCLPICFDIPVSAQNEIISRVLPRYVQRVSDLGIEMDEGRLRDLFHVYFPDLRGLANRIEFETFATEAISA